MSEPKLISPMLDNFDMGGPISDHDGVRCCPAMRKNSDDKFIVKIISVPASQTKLEALLLTGAYSNRSAALEYFKEQAEGIIEEKKILDNLAQIEGFTSFADCQVVPMEDATGYDVYLLSEYRMTLERKYQKVPMSQLSAVNLGIDLCAALSCCRRSGYMFVDLKPSNIYVVGDKDYRIGDLGFVRLNSLKYESMPDKYRSSYTAPEVADAFAALNDTMDIYSAGLILYQVFNGGALPFSGNQAPCEKFEAPVYADEEMAAIILKACDPNPAERWKDPTEMGQAIVSYMQKNGVNDTPLTAEFFGTEETSITEPDQEEEILETEEKDDKDFEAILDVVSELEAEPVVAVIEETAEEVIEEQHEAIAEFEDAVAESNEVSFVDSAVEDIHDTQAEEESFSDDSEEAQEIVAIDETEDIAQLSNDEIPESEEGTSISEQNNSEEQSDEISAILSQVDELVAHQVPEPFVAPEPVEIQLPQMPVSEVEAEDSNESEDAIDDEEIENEIEDISEAEKPYVPKKKRRGLAWLIIILLLLAIGFGANYFYTEYYLQEVASLNLVGIEDVLKVQISSDADESLLTVVCADSHGNKISSPVVGGMAVFSGLTSDTAYTVSVEIDGFHKLQGVTTKVYSTPIQTQIAQTSIVTGTESGSVILSFAVDGPDSNQWNVIYTAEGEAERVTTFPAHMVTLTGLTVGKEYTFRLEPVDDIYLKGNTETTYVARNLICAENLHISNCADGTLTAQWSAPQDETVSEWTVRCYNDAGYDQTLITSENTATFDNIDDSAAYSVEVTAAEMSVSQRVQVSANSVTLSKFKVDDSNAATLTLSWKANRDIPAGGWTIRYSINGVNTSSPIITKKNTAKVSVVPNGNYVFTILDNNGNAVLGGPFTHTQKAASAFSAYGLKQKNISIRLCKTPAAQSWSYKDLKDEDYTNTFAAGQKVSMVLTSDKSPISADNDIVITYAIYDENDNLVSYSHDSQIWQSMWYKKHCELDIPVVPTELGVYKVVLLFDGTEVGFQKFEVIA